MARFTGPNRQQQAELKRKHADKISAEKAAEQMQIDLKAVKNWYSHFEKGGTITNPAAGDGKAAKEGPPPTDKK